MTMSPETKTSEALTQNLPTLYRDLIEHSPLPMAAAGGKNHIVGYVNPAFCNLVGKKKEDLIGHPFSETGQKTDNCIVTMDRVYRTGKAETCGEQGVSGSHIRRRFHAVWAIPDHDGRPAGIIIQLTGSAQLSIINRQLAAMNEQLMVSAVRQHEMLEEKERLNSALQVEIAERRKTEEAQQKLNENLIRNRDALRNLATELVLVEERERKKVSVILHDEVAQSMAAARLRVNMLNTFIEREDARHIAKEALDLIATSIQQTRALMSDLANPVLYDLGLKVAVQRLTEMLADDIAVDFSSRGRFEMDMDVDVKVTLYQIAKELLKNVEKHSNAKNVTVRLTEDNSGVGLLVSDNGRGFDVSILSSPDKEGGFGLFSIRERVSYFNGAIAIQSEPCKGTTVKIEIPKERHVNDKI